MASNIIVMTRGDTYRFDVTIFSEDDITDRYELTENDVVYFGIMYPHQKFEDAIIRKRFVSTDVEDNGRVSITIEPEDTVDLEPGVYYYAVKLKQTRYYPLDNGETEEYSEVTTVINKTKLVLND